MQTIKSRFPAIIINRVLITILSTLVLLSSNFSFLIHSASAYSLLGDREIKMSTSEGGATGATYAVDFDVATANDIGGIVIAFCAGASSPIIGDTDCVHPTGFDLSSAGVANLSNGTGGTVNLAGFTWAFTDHANAAGTNTLELTKSAPEATGITIGDAVQFEITGIVNPSTIGTFYARIMTYATEAEAQNYTLADPDNIATHPIVEAGGIALSTAEQIVVEAKVQERLEFCVYTSAADYTGCSTVSVSNPVVLGDVNGVLSSTQPSISKDTKYNITTNAGQGATVRIKGTTLTSGLLTIDPVGDVTPGDGVANTSSVGSEQFGFCTYTDAGSLDAGLTPSAPYNDASCNTTVDGQGPGNDASVNFAFNDSEMTSTYGDSMATKSSGDWSTGIMVLLGNVSNITEPGIYVTTFDVIATGRY